MSWFVVGGIAIGATAGAIHGSQKGGDDVWKGALIGGALGGAGGYALAPAAAGAAPAAGAALAPEAAGVVGAAGGAAPAASSAGILSSGQLAGGAAGSSAFGAGASGAGGAGIMSAAPTAATAAAPTATAGGMGLGQAGGFAGTQGAAFGGSGASFGSSGAAAVPQGGGLLNAPAQAMGTNAFGQAPIQMAQTPELATVEASSAGDIVNGVQTAANPTPSTQSIASQSPLEKGWSSAVNWLSEPKNAMLTGVLGLSALSMFNDDQAEFGNDSVTQAGYPLSPNFKPSRYQPTRSYADGGPVQGGMYPQSQIPDRTQFAVPTQMPASMEVVRSDYDTMVNPYTGEPPRFASGGSTKKNPAMIDPRMNVKEERAPSWVGRSVANVNDPGLYIDRDEDTAYQDALTAAKTRMGKAAKGANVKLSAMQKPTPLGKVNLGPVAGVEEERKATGGITGLGGYAHGGNPRLLRGPGDGMSDDIPATIADKQPARLADGEFVVPADVVSGLGNGSTEAGAKKLHQMMDKVRVDRTGTKKQGKQINAEKYIPGAKSEKKASGGIASYADGGQLFTQNEYGEYVPYEAPTVTTAPVAPTANTTAQGFGTDDYYNQPYWQAQLEAANKQLIEGQSVLDQYKNRNNDAYLYDLSNLSQTAQQNPELNALYQQYLGRNIYQGEQFAQTPESIISSPEAKAWAEASKANTEAQSMLEQAQQNLSRLENTGIKYDPYTLASRPSAAEPQFYGNIYRGHMPDYSTPGYTLTGGNLGEWSNVAGEAQRAAQPASTNQQMTQAYLQSLGRAPDTGGFNYWMNSGLTGPEAAQQMQISPEGQQMTPGAVSSYYERALGRPAEEAAMNYWGDMMSSGSQTPAQVLSHIQNTPEGQAAAAPKAQQKPEEKKRRGGILAAKK
jgi:hypothetical protein